MDEITGSVESAVKTVADGALKGVELEIAAISKTWSLMEAAAEKTPASELLSPGAIRRMQKGG